MLPLFLLWGGEGEGEALPPPHLPIGWEVTCVSEPV